MSMSLALIHQVPLIALDRCGHSHHEFFYSTLNYHWQCSHTLYTIVLQTANKGWQRLQGSKGPCCSRIREHQEAARLLEVRNLSRSWV